MRSYTPQRKKSHGSARVGSEHTHAPGTKITLQATQTGLMDRLDAQNRGVVLLHAELHAPTEKNAMAARATKQTKTDQTQGRHAGGGLVAHLVPKTRPKRAEGLTTGLPCRGARFPARGELVLLATNEVAPRRNLRLKRTAQK